MKFDVLNKSGQSTGRSVDLPDEVFGIEPNDHVIYLAVKQYLAAQRQGTHKAKERGEITGSTKKIKRQKGTGTARAGSIKSPLFRGGGRMFGPRPRNYKIKLNKKVKDLARKSAFSYKAKEDRGIIVLEDLSFDVPKTKQYAEVLNNLGLNGKKTLLVLNESDTNVVKSVRNIEKATSSSAKNLNTYSILDCNTLIISESAVEALS